MLAKGLRVLFVTSLVTAVVAVGALVAYAAQYNPPWAHLHSQTSAGTDLFGTAGPWVDEMGYNCYRNVNQSSYAGYTYWKSDAVFAFCGHGTYVEDNGNLYWGGGIEFPSGAIRAEDKLQPNRANVDPMYFVKNMGNTDIDDTLVGLFIGCYTGIDGNRYGDLLNWSRAKGIDCAIGWTSGLKNGAASVFGMGFFKGARYENRKIDYPKGYNGGGDVDLMQYAYSYMLQQCPLLDWETDTRLRNWRTEGQYGQRLQPARYGTP